MQKLRPALMGAYGLAVIVSGLIRFFSAVGGTNGLGFGLVMGGWALVAAVLLLLRWKVLGLMVGWSAVLIVGTWFCLELQDKYDQPRIWVIIALSLAMVGVLLWPERKASATPSTEPHT